jgi:hypothetical protein
MRDLFKWIDRIAAIITVATFAYSVLHFFGFVPAPRIDLSNGRGVFLALAVYELVFAVAVSGISALLFRWSRNVFASMVPPVVAWSFVNVDAMQTLFGATLWGPQRSGWWIFQHETPQNSFGFMMVLIGAALFLALYTGLFIQRASQARYADAGDASADLARMNAAMVIMGAVITAFLAHLAWIWLGAQTAAGA